MIPKIELKPIEEAPNLQQVKDAFGVTEKTVIISYGDAIYTPDGLSRDLMVHEMVHLERQGFNKNSAKRWWQKYMEDKEFRLNEEVIAYREQYKYCCKVYKDRNRQAKILHGIAKILSGSDYGNICELSTAKRLLLTN